MTVHNKVKKEAIEILLDGGITCAILAIDISYNESSEKKYADHWLVHLRGHIARFITLEEKEWLRSAYPATQHIHRPLFVRKFDGKIRGLAYSMKPDFYRRQTYVQHGRREGRQNTRGRPIRGRDAVELGLFLDQIGFSGRLCLHGVVLIGHGVTLRFGEMNLLQNDP